MPQLKATLDSIYPGLFNALVGTVIMLVLWALKKVAPDLFEKLPPSLQAAPAMLFAGLASNLASTQDATMNTLLGAATGGVFGVGLHRVLKESPLPYGNEPQEAVANMPSEPPGA